MSAILIISGIVAKVGELKDSDTNPHLTLCIPENIYLGEGREKTEWHYLTLWKNQAELAARLLHKGSVIQARCSVSHVEREGEGRRTYFNVRQIDFLKDFGKNGQSIKSDPNQTESAQGVNQDGEIPF